MENESEPISTKKLPYITELLLKSSGASDFFNLYLEFKKKNNPRISIRSISQKLGYKSPSLLASIIKSERPIGSVFLKKFYKLEKLTNTQAQYLENLIDLENLNNQNTKRYIVEENQTIADTWLGRLKHIEDIELIDIMILSMIGFSKEISSNKLKDSYQKILEPELIDKRLEVLLKNKQIQKNKNNFSLKNVDVNFEITPETYCKFFPIISKASSLCPKRVHREFLTTHLSEEQYDEVIDIIDDATHSILLLMREADQLDVSKKNWKQRGVTLMSYNLTD